MVGVNCGFVAAPVGPRLGEYDQFGFHDLTSQEKSAVGLRSNFAP